MPKGMSRLSVWVEITQDINLPLIPDSTSTSAHNDMMYYDDVMENNATLLRIGTSHVCCCNLIVLTCLCKSTHQEQESHILSHGPLAQTREIHGSHQQSK